MCEDCFGQCTVDCLLFRSEARLFVQDYVVAYVLDASIKET